MRQVARTREFDSFHTIVKRCTPCAMGVDIHVPWSHDGARGVHDRSVRNVETTASGFTIIVRGAHGDKRFAIRHDPSMIPHPSGVDFPRIANGERFTISKKGTRNPPCEVLSLPWLLHV